MIDELAGLVWLASAVAGGVLAYTLGMRTRQAILVGFTCLACQLALSAVIMGFLQQFIVFTNRNELLDAWATSAFSLSVPMFWALVTRYKTTQE